jgi:hypothetical protein
MISKKGFQFFLKMEKIMGTSIFSENGMEKIMGTSIFSENGMEK